MKRDVFYHSAYETYPDLLEGVRALLPFVTSSDTASLDKRFIELDREAHARASRPYHVDRDEAEHTRTRLAAFGLVNASLPEVAADSRWRHLLRSLARLERIRELDGPVDLFRDSFLSCANDLTAQPYKPPSHVGWARPCDFIRDAIDLAATTRDDVGIAGAINETPEATEFFQRYPDAYSFWDIHGTPDIDEDSNLPDPLRFPAAVWTAAAISLAEPFADLPCGSDGPPTIQPVDLAPATRLHPALARSCETAARNGHVLVGFVEVHT